MRILRPFDGLRLHCQQRQASSSFQRLMRSVLLLLAPAHGTHQDMSRQCLEWQALKLLCKPASATATISSSVIVVHLCSRVMRADSSCVLRVLTQELAHGAHPHVGGRLHTVGPGGL